MFSSSCLCFFSPFHGQKIDISCNIFIIDEEKFYAMMVFLCWSFIFCFFVQNLTQTTLKIMKNILKKKKSPWCFTACLPRKTKNLEKISFIPAGYKPFFHSFLIATWNFPRWLSHSLFPSQKLFFLFFSLQIDSIKRQKAIKWRRGSLMKLKRIKIFEVTQAYRKHFISVYGWLPNKSPKANSALSWWKSILINLLINSEGARAKFLLHL